MSKVGNYEILDELSVTASGSVSRARRASGEAGDFAVKRFVVPVDDPSEPNWELQTFLDRARAQQTLAVGGARHWAPIHDLGIDGDTSWYVTDYLPLSVAKLMSGRVALKGDALIAVMIGLLQALSELKALRNRPHGNLKPQNVLISGANLTTATVLLTDPATNGQAAKLGEAGDVRAVGEILHGLVVHRLPPLDKWEVPPSSHWDALGARGTAWRKLCCDLLNLDPGLRLKLPAIAQRLAALRSRKKMRLRRVLVTATIIGLLGAAGVSVISMLDCDARSQFCQSKRAWFGKFLNAAADPAHRQRWQADPDLKRVLDRIPINDIRAINCDSRQLVRWKYYEYVDVRNANQTIATVEDELPGHWKKVQEADELRKRLDNRGWTQPAEYIASMLEDVKIAPGNDLPAAIDRLLAFSPHIESGLAMADSDWTAFTARLSTAEAMHDPVLTALVSALRKSAASEVQLKETGFTGLEEMKRDADLAADISDAIRDTWPTNLDKDAFDKDVARQIDAKNVSKDDVPKWLALVSYHAYRHDEAQAEALKLRKRLNNTVELIDRAHVAPDETSAFKTGTGEASLAIAEFEQMPFTRRTLADGTFARKRDEVQNRIESLRRFYHPQGPDEWLTALPAIATGSAKINGFWETWRKVLHDELPDMMRDHAIFAARQQASEQMRALLVSLDQAFPPPPPLSNEAYMAAARLRREQAIEKLLPLIDLREPKLDGDALHLSIDAFSQWTTNLVALSKDFPITKELLNSSDRPDEQWKKKQPDFWSDPAVAALVKEDMVRLGRIKALQGASRAELVQAMTGGGAAEVALEAWRLLGADTVRPAWPATAEELTAEFKFRKRLELAFSSLKNPSEKDVPLADMTAQAPVRWSRFVEGASSEEMLKSAWKMREAFAVDDKTIASLSPAARYDLDLNVLHTAIAAGEPKDLHEALANLATAASALKDKGAVSELPARIALVDAAEPFADRSPGDTFSFSPPGVAQPLLFKRVEPTSTRPFYLCTTAVSVSQFIGVMDAAHAWPQAKKLPWPCETGKPDTRRGPRTWEWAGTSASPMTPPLLWLSPEEYNDYPQSFRAGRFNRMALSEQVGGNPTGDHPIQYISGEVALFYAGLCGCRLPTPMEWQAAYEGFEKGVPLERWNLRDQTWETQRRYVASGGGSRWPDEGIFVPGSSHAANGRSATSRPENDGALFFQPVTASGGVMFHHLVGNVATFACDASETFDHLSDKNTAAGVEKFIEALPKSLYVIGGSALSAPEVPFDKPLPVEHPEQAYADVGMRLAFTAPSRSLAEKVKWAIGSPPFVWPAAKEVEAKAEGK